MYKTSNGERKMKMSHKEDKNKRQARDEANEQVRKDRRKKVGGNKLEPR